MKRPAFQFYPADWRKDVELRSCSIAARGLWIDMLCIAHECEPYGHLTINGRPMTAPQIAGQCGLPAAQAKKLIEELIANGVARVTPEGGIYSNRMVEDEALRNRRADGGKAGSEHGHKGAEHGAKGGRPKAERGDKKPPLPDAKEPPIKPPPSSSSSPSGLDNPNGLSVPGDAEDPGDNDEEFRLEPQVLECPHQEIIALYHAELPMLRQVREWGDVRQGYLRARWRERPERQNLDWWRGFFGYVKTCPLLVGQHSSRDHEGWQADLEWLVRPTNFTKVIEGKYQAREAA